MMKLCVDVGPKEKTCVKATFFANKNVGTTSFCADRLGLVVKN